jgi:hypothetical protein
MLGINVASITSRVRGGLFVKESRPRMTNVKWGDCSCAVELKVKLMMLISAWQNSGYPLQVKLERASRVYLRNLESKAPYCLVFNDNPICEILNFPRELLVSPSSSSDIPLTKIDPSRW